MPLMREAIDQISHVHRILDQNGRAILLWGPLRILRTTVHTPSISRQF